MLKYIKNLFFPQPKIEDNFTISKLEVLSFGNAAAETEMDLNDYFLKTPAWKRYIAGDYQLILGAKGAGKSAFFRLPQIDTSLQSENTVMISKADFDADVMTSKFKGITPDEFAKIWRIYIVVQILGAYMPTNPEASEYFDSIRKAMGDHLDAALHNANSETIISGILKFLGNLGKNANLELKIKTPVGSAKINAAQVDAEQETTVVPISDIYGRLNNALTDEGKVVWVILDRLDTAFGSDLVMERKALRGLLEATRAALQYSQIHVKLFLRSDIWDTLNHGGGPIREATHLEQTTLTWGEPQIIQLIFQRFFHVKTVRDYAGLGESWINLSQDQKKDALFRLLPYQVDHGEKKPTSLNWIITRLTDGNKDIVPRDVIYFLKKLKENTERRLDANDLALSDDNDKPLFDAVSMKDSIADTSEYKLQQFLYSEFPELRPLCEQLRGGKSTIRYDELADLWGLNDRKMRQTLQTLTRLGFFSSSQNFPNGPIPPDMKFTVPFIYRAALDLTYPY